MMEQVWYGDVELSSILRVAWVSRKHPKMQYDRTEVPSFDGYVIGDVTYLPAAVTIRFMVDYEDTGMRRDAARMVAAALMSKEPKRLEISSDNGLWCMAIVDGQPDYTELITKGSLKVSFMPMEAAMYGQRNSVAVASSTTFLIGGTYPTALRVSGTATPANGLFGIRADGMDYQHVSMQVQSSIVIDSGERYVTVGGDAKSMTLDSDWLVLDVGPHTVEIDNGSGNLTVEWYERWI